MRHKLPFLLLIFSVWAITGLSQTPVSKTFHPDTLTQELRALFTELAKKHPGFYRYNEPQDFDPYLDSVISTIQTPLTELEIYRLVKPLFAKIGCLHTSIGLSTETEQTLNAAPNCLPLDLFYQEGKVYVKDTYISNSDISPGDEVLSINGREVSSIYSEILSHIPMDGYNTSGKYKLLTYSFPIWYRNVIEIDTLFEVEIRKKGENQMHVLSGVKAEVFPSYEDLINEALHISFQGETAIIRIPSFANSYYENKGQNFEKELKNFMERIREQKSKYLILDLRNNTGGSDSHAAFLASQFFTTSFRYWDRIEVTEDIAREVRGSSKLFYGKPKQENGVWLWHGSGISSYEFSFFKAQKPAKHPFTGKVFALIDGACMSSCADFAAIMQHNKKAVFIGEETGGGYQGNTSGIIPEETLSSGLVISIPLLKYFNAVDPTQNRGRGTQPEYPVSMTIEAYLNAKDPMMEKAVELIDNL